MPDEPIEVILGETVTVTDKLTVEFALSQSPRGTSRDDYDDDDDHHHDADSASDPRKRGITTRRAEKSKLLRIVGLVRLD